MIGIIFILIPVVMLVLFYFTGKEKKSIKKIDGFNIGIFELRYSRLIRNIAKVCFACITCFFAMCTSSYFAGLEKGDGTVEIVIYFFVAWIFALWFVMKACIWKISVEREIIMYRNFCGVKKTYNFKEIEVFSDKQGNLRIYQNNKKIFKITTTIEDIYYFLYWAQKYKVYKNVNYN